MQLVKGFQNLPSKVEMEVSNYVSQGFASFSPGFRQIRPRHVTKIISPVALDGSLMITATVSAKRPSSRAPKAASVSKKVGARFRWKVS